MNKYYSQNGEDYLLSLMFQDKANGFFVEVGCIDGKRFSNTLHFEEKGWKGICVEAHPDYIPLLKANRSSIICHCAIGEVDKDDVIFFANKRGSLSTLDPSQETRWRRKFPQYFSGFEEKHVPERTLTRLFRENGVSQIDILSLDIEGYEVPALKGLDLTIYRPLVMVIETDSRAQEHEQDAILLPQDYQKAGRISANIFYTTDTRLAECIKNVRAMVKLIHTRHPLDQGEDKFVEKRINTASKFSLSNIFKTLLK